MKPGTAGCSLLAVGVLVSLAIPVVGNAQDSVRCIPESRLGPQTLPAGYALSATVEDVGSGLSSDGRGIYWNGKDGIASPGIFAAWSLNLFSWAGSNGQTNQTRRDYTGAPPGRALRFNLDRPVPGSGARALGTVLDSVGRIHVFWRDLQDVRTVVPTLLMRVRDTVTSDRVELFVRAEGHQYVLQFGPWTMGRYSGRAAGGTIMHGDGTTRAVIERPRYERWLVRSAPGSIGRLWLFDDVQRPEDRGLYYFDFAFEFTCRG